MNTLVKMELECAGPSKIPGLGKEVGKAAKSFQQAAKVSHLHSASMITCCKCCVGHNRIGLSASGPVVHSSPDLTYKLSTLYVPQEFENELKSNAEGTVANVEGGAETAADRKAKEEERKRNQQ